MAGSEDTLGGVPGRGRPGSLDSSRPKLATRVYLGSLGSAKLTDGTKR